MKQPQNHAHDLLAALADAAPMCPANTRTASTLMARSSTVVHSVMRSLSVGTVRIPMIGALFTTAAEATAAPSRNDAVRTMLYSCRIL